MRTLSPRLSLSLSRSRPNSIRTNRKGSRVLILSLTINRDMYPSSSSSSSQGSLGPSGLVRYGSAPGSLLTTAVDSAVRASCDFSTTGSQSPLETRYFSGKSSPAAMESSGKLNEAADPKEASNWGGGLQGSLGSDGIATASNLKNGVGSSSSPSLVRHRSSPAGFLNHLNTALTGFPFTRGVGSYDPKGVFGNDHGISRLNSQLSFTRQDSLSRISEKDENIIDGGSTDNGHRKTAHSYATASFGMGSWDDTNAFMFSAPPSKRAKNFSGDIVSGHNTVESQFQFSLSQTALEMATMENLLQIPQDSVPCKTRAKRGCATHPRSIAERDRRNRISGKLKKLQDLVPNMDKQTSYADMLDLAVQHIKGLQNQIQKLKNELESCTCGCKTAI